MKKMIAQRWHLMPDGGCSGGAAERQLGSAAPAAARAITQRRADRAARQARGDVDSADACSPRTGEVSGTTWSRERGWRRRKPGHEADHDGDADGQQVINYFSYAKPCWAASWSMPGTTSSRGCLPRNDTRSWWSARTPYSNAQELVDYMKEHPERCLCRDLGLSLSLSRGGL